MDLQLPSSQDEIDAIQSRRKRVAFERAKRAPFYAGRLDGIDPDRLDDPDEWAKIPIIDKEALREIPADAFEDRMVVCERREIAEYWRSGGATGVPIYPKSGSWRARAVSRRGPDGRFRGRFQHAGAARGGGSHG